MKKLAYISMVALLMAACHKDEIPTDGFNDIPVTGKVIYKQNNNILLTDLQTKVISTISDSPVSGNSDFRISKNGRLYAFKHTGNTGEDPQFYIRIVDIESMETVNTITGMDHRTTGMAWSTDHTELATIHWPTNSIRIYNVESGRYRDVFLPGESPWKFDLANSLLDWSKMDELVFSVRHPEYPYSMGDMRLAFMFSDGSGFRFLVPENDTYSTIDYPREVVFSPDGEKILLRKGWVVSKTVITDRLGINEEPFWDYCILDPAWSGDGQFIMATYLDETDLMHPKYSIQVKEVNGEQEMSMVLPPQTQLLDWLAE